MSGLVGNMPWTVLAAAFGVCLVISALGFRRVDWFISLGYGFSIAAEAVLFGIAHGSVLSLWLLAQLVLLFAYGVRLGGYLVIRERAASFAGELKASRQRSAHIASGAKLAIWVTVAALYVAMASPALFNLAAAAAGTRLATLPAGVAIMLAGLLLEAFADWQKSRFKAQQPHAFVQHGLYAVVRSPNYFGEMLFWLGGFIAGLSGYQGIGAWVLAAVGLVCIELIMLGSARRLELKQAERYGDNPAYRDYVRRVPILVPLLPLYSLRNLRIYLG